MLYEKIGQMRIAAMKAKDKTTLSTLTTLKGDIDRRRVNINDAVTDELVIATIKATLKALREMIDEKVKHGIEAEQEQQEVLFLEQFMPKMIDAATIESHVHTAIAMHGDSKAAMGKIMGYLKGIEGMDMAIAKGIVQSSLK